MSKVKVCILRTAGTNCDQETAAAFEKAGANTERVHINRFVSGEKSFQDFHILAFPGGFSYGDDIASGKILANELRSKLAAELKKFIADGKLMIGICNGFQILVKAGLLPGNAEFRQSASLIINDSGKFEARWTYLSNAHSRCIWTKGLAEVIYLPVAHGEGKFITEDPALLNKLKNNGQIVFQYCDEAGKFGAYPINPNGSTEHIAGICDETGRIFGLMPHPERHMIPEQHPRYSGSASKAEGDGLAIFKNGVSYVQNNLL